MVSQIERVNEDYASSTMEAQSEANDIETGVEAIWKKMNKEVSNNMIKTFSNKSRANATSRKHNNNWATYLGLVPKVSEVNPDDARENRQTVASDEDQRVSAMWEKMNEGLPDKTSRTILSKSTSATNNSSKNKSDNWMSYLGIATKKADGMEHYSPQSEHRGIQNGTSDEARKLAAAALSAVKNAAAVTSGRGKVEITEVREFAGQEIELKKFVDAESKDAAEKGKAPAPSAVDAVLEQIKKKQKLSVLDKTKKDWGEFKEENKGLEEQLDAYKKSSNQYLDKVSFLERTDYREFERERDARLALHSRRRPDMRED